jgi:hypothetical protein
VWCRSPASTDVDYIGGENFRAVQLTPPGSECSILIGEGITSAAPGSLQGLHLIVVDIKASRAELVGRGAKREQCLPWRGGSVPNAPSVAHRRSGAICWVCLTLSNGRRGPNRC